jgi:hypothetical protein
MLTPQEEQKRQRQYEEESLPESIAWIGLIIIVILCLLANNI